MNTVCIVILNWNGKESTFECLNSVQKLEKKNFEITTIVVDNGSQDNSPEELSKKYPWVVLIANKENLGYCGGANVGIRYALRHNADSVLVLNNDTVLDPKLVIEFLKTLENDSNIGIVSPKIYFSKGREYHKEQYKKQDLGKVLWYAGGSMDWQNVIGNHRGVDEVDRGQYDREIDIDYASGCCMLIKSEVLKKIGLFDERYYLYYEDSDLSERIKRKGYKIVFCPKAVLWHKNAESAGGSGSHLQDYYITRNRLLFGFNYAPLRSKIALFRQSIALLVHGRPWQKRGVLDFYLHRLGKGSFQIKRARV